MAKETMNLVDSLNNIHPFFGSWSNNGLYDAKPFDIIRNEPRFKEILAEAKKMHDERVAKYGNLFDDL